MAKAAKKKPKPKSSKFSDKAQSERFVEAARKLGVEEAGDKFEEAFKRLIPKGPAS